MSERLRIWRIKAGQYEVSIDPFDLENYNCDCVHGSNWRFRQDNTKPKCKHYKMALKILMNAIQKVVEENDKHNRDESRSV